MFLKNKNFFNEPLSLKDEREINSNAQEIKESHVSEPVTGVNANLEFHDGAFIAQIQKLEKHCQDAGRKDLLEQMAAVKEYLVSDKFTVAVVGEFNRGKSTLVNRLIGKDIIPTSDIPTTTLPIYVSGRRTGKPCF